MKKAIIVGASSGIGKALAALLAQHNYVVGITGRRKEKLEALQSTNPDRFIVKAFDCTGPDTVKNLEELVRELGGLDLLVLSSGTGELNDELDFQKEKITIDLNVSAFTEIVDWSFLYFLKQGNGHLAAITSIGGLRGSQVAPAYNATKSYQINYLEGLRQKASKSKADITVTDIRPGFVDTDMAKGDGLFWVAPKEKAAEQIYRAIRRKKHVSYVTRRWLLIALVLKRLPRFLYNRM